MALGFKPQEAVAEAMRCLAGQIEGCIECGECKRRCEAKAIDYEQKEENIELNVGAIILSPGTSFLTQKPNRNSVMAVSRMS